MWSCSEFLGPTCPLEQEQESNSDLWVAGASPKRGKKHNMMLIMCLLQDAQQHGLWGGMTFWSESFGLKWTFPELFSQLLPLLSFSQKKSFLLTHGVLLSQKG